MMKKVATTGDIWVVNDKGYKMIGKQGLALRVLTGPQFHAIALFTSCLALQLRVMAAFSMK